MVTFVFIYAVENLQLKHVFLLEIGINYFLSILMPLSILLIDQILYQFSVKEEASAHTFVCKVITAALLSQIPKITMSHSFGSKEFLFIFTTLLEK